MFSSSLNNTELIAVLEMNLFRAATFPVKLCTSFIVFGDLISIIAFTLSGFASMPRWETMNLKNFPEVTAKTHFAGFTDLISYYTYVVC